MTRLWSIRSGYYFGCIGPNGYLYDRSGTCVGFVSNDVAFTLAGVAIGEIRNGDQIGRRASRAYPRGGARVGTVGISVGPAANRAGIAIAGWADPHE